MNLKHTLNEARHEAMSLSIHETALSGHANGCQDVVTSHHDCANVGRQKLLENCSSRGLKLVLENNETNEVEITLYFSSSHLLSLDPAKLLEMAAGDTNNTVTFVSIPRQKLVVIIRDCGKLASSNLSMLLGNLQLSARQISFIASGAPFTKISPLFWPNCRTMTLARRRLETNSKDFCTPSSMLPYKNVSDHPLTVSTRAIR